MRQILLQNTTAILLQNTTSLLQNASGLLLQNATVLSQNVPVITKCDVYYKLPQYIQKKPDANYFIFPVFFFNFRAYLKEILSYLQVFHKKWNCLMN